MEDLAITRNEIGTVKDQIASQWEMEDLGVAKSIVGIHVSWLNDHSYFLDQCSLARTILECFDFEHLKTVSTPLPVTSKLYRSSDEESEAFPLENKPYRSGVGLLMYLAMCTRPDLAHSVRVLSQHLERPGKQPWDAFVHVFCYLKGTIQLGIKFNSKSSTTIAGAKSQHVPESLCDADWAGNPNTRWSTTGYVFKLAG